MTIYLKQSTAGQEVTLGYFLDSTDGNAEETGLTIANTDVKLHKAGATTLANKNSGGATHISNGIYYAVLDATDTDTLGSLVIYCHPTGALATRVECVVLAANVYDSMIGGGDLLDVQVSGVDANALTASALAADAVTEIQTGLATQASVDTVDANVDAILVDTGTTIPAQISALNNVSSADVNAACDTAIADASLATAANLATVDSNVGDIKAKTDDLTFTKANELDTNIQSVNGTTVQGDGQTGTEWGPA